MMISIHQKVCNFKTTYPLQTYDEFSKLLEKTCKDELKKKKILKTFIKISFISNDKYY